MVPHDIGLPAADAPGTTFGGAVEGPAGTTFGGAIEGPASVGDLISSSPA